MGTRDDKAALCPAAVEKNVNGLNNGINGGRACWAIDGTPSQGKSGELFVRKIYRCIDCSFYNQVLHEEGPGFVPAMEIREILGLHQPV